MWQYTGQPLDGAEERRRQYEVTVRSIDVAKMQSRVLGPCLRALLMAPYKRGQTVAQQHSE